MEIKDCVGGFIVNESSGANFICIHCNLGRMQAYFKLLWIYTHSWHTH